MQQHKAHHINSTVNYLLYTLCSVTAQSPAALQMGMTCGMLQTTYADNCEVALDCEACLGSKLMPAIARHSMALSAATSVACPIDLLNHDTDWQEGIGPALCHAGMGQGLIPCFDARDARRMRSRTLQPLLNSPCTPNDS